MFLKNSLIWLAFEVCINGLIVCILLCCFSFQEFVTIIHLLVHICNLFLLFDSVPLCDDTTICFFIYYWWVLIVFPDFLFCDLNYYKCFCSYILVYLYSNFPCVLYPEMELQGHRACVFSAFQIKVQRQLFKLHVQLTWLLTVIGVFPHLFHHLVMSDIFTFANLLTV